MGSADADRIGSFLALAGARILWLYNGFGLSGEWVNRTAFNVDASSQVAGLRTVTFRSSTRAVGMAEYKIANEMYATISFGEDFKTLGVERRPLVASFGLQLLYGDKPAIKAP